MKSARTVEYIVYTLLLLGVVFIYNSSAAHSQNIFGNPHRFFVLHVVWVVLSVAVFNIFIRLDYRKLINISWGLYVVTLFLLLVLAVTGIVPCAASPRFAPCINNANRWLVLNFGNLVRVPFVADFNIQPSELAKYVLILFLALKLGGGRKKDSSVNFKAYLIYTLVFSGLILLQPNMSTALIIISVGTIMFFVSGADIKPLLVLIPFALLISVLLVLVSPYRRDRLLSFLGNSTTGTQAPEGYQVKQVKIALGSGGVFGVGFGQSRQKYTYLPEVATDSIFGIIGEEFGFLGTAALLSIFMFLVFQGFEIGRKCEHLEGRLVAIGITSWIGLQFLVHVSANSGLIPYTGVPLPLISYGGSSMLFSMIGLGTLVNIGRQNKYNS